MSVHIDVDASDALRELKRLQQAPSHALYVELVGVTEAQFQATQAFVHVQTGSLKASGKRNPHYDHAAEQYIGEISYGGAAPDAVHDPVTYAKYEQRRAGLRALYGGAFKARTIAKHPGKFHAPHPSAHATSHNFMEPLAGFEPFYTEAILDFMRGHL